MITKDKEKKTIRLTAEHQAVIRWAAMGVALLDNPTDDNLQGPAAQAARTAYRNILGATLPRLVAARIWDGGARLPVSFDKMVDHIAATAEEAGYEVIRL